MEYIKNINKQVVTASIASSQPLYSHDDNPII